jgi:serine/threonine protein kinase
VAETVSGRPVSLKELPLPSIASLRAIASLKAANLAIVRPARIGLGFETAGGNQKTLADIEETLGGPGRLSLPYSLRWLLDVLTGLGVLHRTLSFVHGEVQPEHIVLGEDGVGRLIPVVRAHWVRGEERNPERLYYLAPEKLLGDSVDVRSDVFSVGVMLWEALAGQRLLEAYVVDDIIARLMGGGIPRPHAPEAEAWTAPLAGIAERAIAVDPGRRFATVAEMKAAIESTCSRYLASAPGMAELFENPARRARSHVRDSLPPDSQRLTQPPVTLHREAVAATGAPKNEAALEAAAERLARSSYASIDPEDATTVMSVAAMQEDLTKVRAPSPRQDDVTKVMSVPKDLIAQAPVPVVRKGAHINTLLGVPPPYINHDRDSSAPEEPTRPRGSIRPVAPVVLTPLPPVPSSPVPVNVHRPAPVPQMTLPLGSAPPPFAPAESRRGISLSPLIAAPPVRAEALPIEPSFELVRPRKSRGALWLVLGAAVAIGLFAARPWLARQVAAATGALPDNGVTNVDTAPNTPAPLPAPTPTPSAVTSAAPEASEAPRAVGIASTPAAPSAEAPTRGHGGGREEHVVIHDAVEPNVTPPAAPAPAPPKPEPVAPPKPEPAAPAAPAPAPKTRPVPVSDADRYGI